MGRASSVSALRGARLGTATLQPSPRPSVRHHKGLNALFPMLYSVGLLTTQPVAKKLRFRAADSQA